MLLYLKGRQFRLNPSKEGNINYKFRQKIPCNDQLPHLINLRVANSTLSQSSISFYITVIITNIKSLPEAASEVKRLGHTHSCIIVLLITYNSMSPSLHKPVALLPNWCKCLAHVERWRRAIWLQFNLDTLY